MSQYFIFCLGKISTLKSVWFNHVDHVVNHVKCWEIRDLKDKWNIWEDEDIQVVYQVPFIYSISLQYLDFMPVFANQFSKTLPCMLQTYLKQRLFLSFLYFYSNLLIFHFLFISQKTYSFPCLSTHCFWNERKTYWNGEMISDFAPWNSRVFT